MPDKVSFDLLRDNLMQLYVARDYTGGLELLEKKEPDFPNKLAWITFCKMCLLSLH